MAQGSLLATHHALDIAPYASSYLLTRYDVAAKHGNTDGLAGRSPRLITRAHCPPVNASSLRYEAFASSLPAGSPLELGTNAT